MPLDENLTTARTGVAHGSLGPMSLAVGGRELLELERLHMVLFSGVYSLVWLGRDVDRPG